MKVYISSTEWAIVCDLKETNLLEWLKCLEEQFPFKERKNRKVFKLGRCK